MLKSQPRVDYRKPSEDELYVVFEVNKEVSFGSELQVVFMALDVSTDDDSRRRKCDSDEPMTAINELVLKNAKPFNDVVPAPLWKIPLTRLYPWVEERMLEPK